MTKEQEEAIERLNRFKTIKILYANTFAMHLEQLEKLQTDIETVINMLKEKDKELEKKDKIIDEIKQLIEENLRKDTILEKGYVYGFNECQYVTRQIVELLRKNNILKEK